MADVFPQFETTDTEGSTTHFNGTVGTTPVTLPASSNGVITEVLLICDEDNNPNRQLEVSFDGGSNYLTLEPGDAFPWSPKGNVTQITIRGTNSNVIYQILMNRNLA